MMNMREEGRTRRWGLRILLERRDRAGKERKVASAGQPRTRGQNQPRRARGRPKRGRWSAAAATHHPFYRVRPNPPVRGFWPATGRARLGSTDLVRLLRPGASREPAANREAGESWLPAFWARRHRTRRLAGSRLAVGSCLGPGPGRLSACGRTRRTALSKLVASEAQVTQVIRTAPPGGTLRPPKDFWTRSVSVVGVATGPQGIVDFVVPDSAWNPGWSPISEEE
ncbi:PREDICTED: uncharacterized protein LOC106725008 [Myotis brandtii]|uniref:uncharacterized protein LOC106725008 n=1 Tax=Myotis brandtii TaxID=109478 RepID=UPI00070431C3|nr:PREDICTED: uncharacterized protein LOC106725008 [Myotis brandtii]